MVENKANDPALRSWVDVPAGSDFPIQNLPFGIFRTESQLPHVCCAIGDKLVDLKALHVMGYLENLPFTLDDMVSDSLNRCMRHGKMAMRELRNRVSKLLRSDMPDLRDKEHHVRQVLFNQNEVQMLLPIKVGDYTDFYSSEDHARNVGIMFRDPAKALLPNWKHIPVGYHGRASSIVISGTPLHRPCVKSMQVTKPCQLTAPPSSLTSNWKSPSSPLTESHLDSAFQQQKQTIIFLA
jgi:fumarylacetoacetase